jgi:hypothetical protein
MAKIQIEIKVPIWKNRSVGISLISSSPSDDVEIEIAYKNKDGVQLYPHVYGLKASEIQAYGVKYVRKGVPLYEVPINDLRIIKQVVNNQLINNQNQSTMLFDKEGIDKIRKENSERGGSNKKKIEMGEQLLILTNAEIAYSKKDKNPMIKLDFNKDEDHKPITEYFMLSGNGSDFGKGKLLSMLENGFGYIMQAAKDEKDVLKQVKKYVGSKLKVAVKYEQSLYDSEKNGTLVALKPGAWYFGLASDNSFKVDINKCMSPLSKEDMERVLRLAENGVEVKGVDGYAIIPAVLKNDNNASANGDALFSNDKPVQEDPMSVQDDDSDGLPF